MGKTEPRSNAVVLSCAVGDLIGPNRMTSLKGRVAIVTGAGRGIGRAIAVRLAQCGADVALVDLEVPAESAALVGPSAVAFAGDVSSEAAWAELGELIDRTVNRVDIIVNNAAFFPRGLID